MPIRLSSWREERVLAARSAALTATYIIVLFSVIIQVGAMGRLLLKLSPGVAKQV